ncbi:hypothetical protein ACFLRW_01010 [Acidobacteriota bacterium]
MDSQNVLIPYIVSHVLTFCLIFVCWKWAKIGKIIWAVIFICAGIFNAYTMTSDPQAYLMYSQWAAGPYKAFINGVFSSNLYLFVYSIAAGQILVGILLFLKRKFFLLGIIGGIIFLIAISPLGIGAAFPSTLLMAFSLILVYVRFKKVQA